MSGYQHFFQVGQIPDNVMYGEYDPYLVFLSYIIACLASYVALDMSAHLRKPTTLLFRVYWLVGGAFIMGAGIWSMHFVGMLSFIMPMTMTYSLRWTGLSMFVAILTAALAFMFFTIQKPQFKHYVMSGIILGAAIPTMHYTGMAGMNGVDIHYKLIPFILSIMIAIAAAVIALWLAIQSDRGTFAKRLQLKSGSALVMGLAIIGMHYMGMYAAVFTPGKMNNGATSLDPSVLALFIATFVIGITVIGLILSTAKFTLASVVQKDKDFLQTVLDHILDGVIACDLKGKITLINHTVEELFGEGLKHSNNIDFMKKHVFLKPSSHVVLTPEEYPMFRTLQGGIVRNLEVMMTDPNGDQHYLSIDGRPLVGNDNEKFGAVIVYHDISALKENEKELYSMNQALQKHKEELELEVTARTKELTEINKQLQLEINNHYKTQDELEKAKIIAESANRAKSLFLANMSHELRTPLNAIIGYNEFLEEELEGKEGLEELVVILKKINSAGAHLLRLVSNVLDISKIESGKLMLNFESFSLDVMINDIIDALSPMFQAKDIVFETDIEDGLGFIWADLTRLKQIFFNLLHNACKFTDSGSVNFSVKKQKIDNQYWLISSIVDSGIGIAPEKLSIIFTSFVQGDNLSAKNHEGAGLGLAICQRFCQMMFGNITVESSEKKGSTFTVRLPIRVVQEERKDA